MNDYILLYLDSVLATKTPTAFISLMLLGLARLLPIIGRSPFFGSRTLPNPVKVAFAITLFFILLPTMLTNLTSPLDFNRYLIVLFMKEMFIGFAIGWIMSTPFSIVQSAGMLIDHQRGGSSLMVNDPTIQNQSSPFGTLFNFILIYVFYFIDGPFYFLEAINTAYTVVPPDRILSPRFFNENVDFWKIQLTILNSIMVITTQLAAPALICILMTDMFLGIANRLAPQVQIIFLGLPLKSLLAMLVVWLGWKAYNEQTVVEVFHWLDILKDSIISMKIS